MKMLGKISFIACCLALAAASGYAQSPAMQNKMEALLQKNVAGAKVYLGKEKNIIEVQEKSATSIYDFKIPWLMVDSKYSLRSPNLKDTVYSVDISCSKGESCITLFENTKEHHTKSIMLSFGNKKDAQAFSAYMKKLKKSK